MAARWGAEDGNADGGDDPIRDEKIKALSDEAAKWRKKFRDLEAQHTEAAPLREELAELRVEKEFYRLAAQRVRDLTAAFKLADRALLTVADDGTLTGMETMVDKVIQNYPFLSEEPETPATRTTGVPDGPKEGGSASNSRRTTGKPTPTSASLRKKFGALGGR